MLHQRLAANRHLLGTRVEVSFVLLVVAGKRLLALDALSDFGEAASPTVCRTQDIPRVRRQGVTDERVVEDVPQISCAGQSLQLAALAFQLVLEHGDLFRVLGQRLGVLDSTVHDACCVDYWNTAGMCRQRSVSHHARAYEHCCVLAPGLG
ncbi:hypothetical protein D3C71_1603220 [compost metagenome]